MIMPPRGEFLKELNNIENDEIKEKLILLYDNIVELKNINNAASIAKEVLSDLFPVAYTNDHLIPQSFIFSAVGTVVFTTLFNYQTYYSLSDVIELTKTEKNPKGFSRQYLAQEAKAENLVGTKTSDLPNSKYLFKEQDVIDYLIKKGIKKKEELVGGLKINRKEKKSNKNN